MANQNSNALRQSYRQRRRALSSTAQNNAAKKLAKHIARNPHYRQAKNIAAYIASDGEINLDAVIRHAQRAGKQVYVPVIRKQGDMRFIRYRPKAKLSHARWGLLEPRRGKLRPKNFHFDLVIMPLVAFDQKGNRLGRGGGYYDRYFAPRCKHAQRSPWLLGAAHALQETKALQSQAWDVALDAVATDCGISTF